MSSPPFRAAPGPRTPRSRVIEGCLLAAILALRIVYLRQFGDSPLATFLVEDQLVYQKRALEILSGQLLGSTIPFYSSTLYPYILAAIYAVTGVHTLSIYFMQHVLGVATCAVIFRAGREMFGDPHAHIAVVLAGLYGTLVFAEGQIMMISWSVFAVALALWGAIRHARTGTWTSALLCGAACGLGMADRPNLVVLPVAILFWWRLMAARVRPSSLVALGAGAGLLIAPVIAIHAATTGGRVLFSASSGINLAIGNNPLSDGTYTEPWASEGVDASRFEGLQNASRHFASRALGRPVDDIEADRYWRQTAFRYILGQPLDALRLLGRKVLLLINRQEIPNIMNFGFYRSQFPALRLFVVGFWLVGPFGALGALLSARRRQSLILPLSLAFYGLSLLPFFVCDRFRLPAIPLLVLLAADGMVACANSVRQRQWRRTVSLAAALAGASALVSLPLNRVDPGRDHWRLAQAFLEAGRPERAIAEYQVLLSLHPEQGKGWTDLAFTQLRLGKIADAEASLRRAIETSPDFGLAHAALGDLLHRRGSIDAALIEYRRAVEVDPSLVEAWLSLARLLQADGELDRARQTLLKGRALNPGVAAFDTALREIGAAPEGP